MITDIVIHSYGDGCYVRVQKGTRPEEQQVSSRIICEQHRQQIEDELARLMSRSTDAA